MTELERIAAARREEQMAGYQFTSQHESEEWAPASLPPRLGRVRLRARCLAGDCDRKVVARHGYCHRHAQKVSRGVALHLDLNERSEHA